MNFNYNLLFQLKKYKSFDLWKHYIEYNDLIGKQYAQVIFENFNLYRFILNDKIKNLNNSCYKFVDIEYNTPVNFFKDYTFNTIFSNIKK